GSTPHRQPDWTHRDARFGEAHRSQPSAPRRCRATAAGCAPGHRRSPRPAEAQGPASAGPTGSAETRMDSSPSA
nr:hypothetical protein [Tanacetum cinerariifolium]